MLTMLGGWLRARRLGITQERLARVEDENLFRDSLLKSLGEIQTVASNCMKQLNEKDATITELRIEIGKLIVENTRAAAKEIVLLDMVKNLEARLGERITRLEDATSSE